MNLDTDHYSENTGSGESGTSVVEFAMIMPVFFLIFFGIVEYGWLMTQEILLTHAVSEGAREALHEADTARRTQVARDKVMSVFKIFGGNHMEDKDISVSLQNSPEQITVEVADLEYMPLVGFIPSELLPESLHAKASFTYPQ